MSQCPPSSVVAPVVVAVGLRCLCEPGTVAAVTGRLSRDGGRCSALRPGPRWGSDAGPLGWSRWAGLVPAFLSPGLEASLAGSRSGAAAALLLAMAATSE